MALICTLLPGAYAALVSAPRSAGPAGVSLDAVVSGDAATDSATQAPSGSTPYDPVPPALGDPPTPLMVLKPVNGVADSAAAAFYLRSRERAWEFPPNLSYESSLMFSIRQEAG